MNPLQNLKDIHLSEPVSWWPPAWGWWLVSIFAILAITITLRFFIRTWRQRAALRQAKAEFAALSPELADYPQQVNRLLKRVMMCYRPAEKIASLHGDAWTQALSEVLPKTKRDEFTNIWQRVQNNLYQPVHVGERHPITQAVTHWLNNVRISGRQDV